MTSATNYAGAFIQEIGKYKNIQKVGDLSVGRLEVRDEVNPLHSDFSFRGYTDTIASGGVVAWNSTSSISTPSDFRTYCMGGMLTTNDSFTIDATATEIIGCMPGAVPGSFIDLDILMTVASKTITINGTGVTAYGTLAVSTGVGETNRIKRLRFRVTSVTTPAVTVYQLA
jgi:hypothetical protein